MKSKKKLKRKPRGMIIIRLDGGIVQQVDGTPKGFDVEVRDYDIDGIDQGALRMDSAGGTYYRYVNDVRG